MYLFPSTLMPVGIHSTNHSHTLHSNLERAINPSGIFFKLWEEVGFPEGIHAFWIKTQGWDLNRGRYCCQMCHLPTLIKTFFWAGKSKTLHNKIIFALNPMILDTMATSFDITDLWWCGLLMINDFKRGLDSLVKPLSPILLFILSTYYKYSQKV